MVRLKDVSRIDLGALNYQQRARLNGKPSCPIGVFQVPGSNAIAVADGVKKTMKELKERFPDDLDYVVALDTTLPVTEGIKEIEHTLFEAIVLVIIVVFLFLQGWRATLIPLLAVPVSLVGTFMFFPMLGFSINTLSLFGLVLAIGLVVDDAIVVVEAVEHHIEHGLSPKDATLKAMEEVTQPVIGIALVLSAVFIPVAFMGGIQGRMNMQFAITIAVSVLISAFNALSLSPALCSLILKPKKESKGPLGKFFAWFNRVFGKMTNGYVNLSHHLVRKVVVTLLILGGFVVLSGLLGKRLPSGFLPDEDQGYFFINVQLPDASSLQRTDAVCQRIEKILGGDQGGQVRHDDRRLQPPLRRLGAVHGVLLRLPRPLGRARGQGDGSRADHAAGSTASFEPDSRGERRGLSAAGDPGPRHGRRLLVLAPGPERRQRRVPEPEPPEVPGSRAKTPRARQRQQRLAALRAPDLRRHQPGQGPQAGRRGRRRLPEPPGVSRRHLREPVQPLRAPVEGLSAGRGVGTRQGRGHQPVLRAQQRRADGAPVRRRDDPGIAGPEFTNRFNLFRAAQVTGIPAPGYSSGQATAALEAVAKEVLPREMGYDWADMSYQEVKAAGAGARVFVLSIIFVFLILAALYESWSLPFSVLLSVPVAVFGAFLGLLMRKFNLDVYGQIGLVMLIGLAAKNAILIVEFAVLQQKEGKSLVDAALEGAKLRLRPILMTSFAFILGCVPLWTATGSGAVSRKVLGTVVIVGMLAATGIAIFLIPALFVMVEKLAHRGKAEEIARARRRWRPPAVGGHAMRTLAAACLVLVLLTGCAVGPDYKTPAVGVPDEYREVQGPPAPAARSPTSPGGRSSATRSSEADRRGPRPQLRRPDRRLARRGVPRARRDRPLGVLPVDQLRRPILPRPELRSTRLLSTRRRSTRTRST